MNDFSVVIPVRNAISTLKECIQSLLSQSAPPREIIIADDASNDGTRELIREMARDNNSIVPILRERNVGVSANRGTALRTAKCAIVSWIDADDLAAPGKFAAELSILNAGKNCVAMSDYAIVTSVSDPDPYIIDVTQFENLPSEALIEQFLLNCGLIPRDLMLSKDLYQRSGGFREDIALYEDWDFKLRLARVSGAWKRTGVLGTRYIREGSGLSASSFEKHAYWRTRILTDNIGWLTESIQSKALPACLLNSLDLGHFVKPLSGEVSPEFIADLLDLIKSHPEGEGLAGPHSLTLLRPQSDWICSNAFGESLETIFTAHGLGRRRPLWQLVILLKIIPSIISADRAVGRPLARSKNFIKSNIMKTR